MNLKQEGITHGLWMKMDFQTVLKYPVGIKMDKLCHFSIQNMMCVEYNFTQNLY